MTRTGLCIATLLIGMLAGCHSGPKLNQSGESQGNAATSQTTNVAPVVVDELDNPNGPLVSRVRNS